MANIFVKMGLQSSGYFNTLDKVRGQTAKTAEDMGNRFDNLGAKIAGAFAVGAVTSFVKKQLDAAGELTRTADILGVQVDQYQALSSVQRDLGGETAALNDILKDLKKNSSEAQNGNTGLLQSFRDLGISTSDLNGDIGDLLSKVAEGEQKTGNYSAQVKILGENALQARPLLQRLASDGIGGITDAAREAGTIIEDELLNNMALYSQELARLERNSVKAGATIAGSFALAARGIANFFKTGGNSSFASVAGLDPLSIDEIREDILKRQAEANAAFQRQEQEALQARLARRQSATAELKAAEARLFQAVASEQTKLDILLSRQGRLEYDLTIESDVTNALGLQTQIADISIEIQQAQAKVAAEAQKAASARERSAAAASKEAQALAQTTLASASSQRGVRSAAAVAASNDIQQAAEEELTALQNELQAIEGIVNSLEFNVIVSTKGSEDAVRFQSQLEQTMARIQPLQDRIAQQAIQVAEAQQASADAVARQRRELEQNAEIVTAEAVRDSAREDYEAITAELKRLQSARAGLEFDLSLDTTSDREALSLRQRIATLSREIEATQGRLADQADRVAQSTERVNLAEENVAERKAAQQVELEAAKSARQGAIRDYRQLVDELKKVQGISIKPFDEFQARGLFTVPNVGAELQQASRDRRAEEMRLRLQTEANRLLAQILRANQTVTRLEII